MKRFLGFVGIVAMMFGWGYLSLTWPGQKPALAYVYVPAVICLIVGAAIRELWRRNPS